MVFPPRSEAISRYARITCVMREIASVVFTVDRQCTQRNHSFAMTECMV